MRALEDSWAGLGGALCIQPTGRGVLMLGRAVPSIGPARKLLGTARMITTTEMEVSGRRMSVRNSGGSGLWARSHPQREGKQEGRPVEKSGR